MDKDCILYGVSYGRIDVFPNLDEAMIFCNLLSTKNIIGQILVLPFHLKADLYSDKSKSYPGFEHY